MTDTFDRDFRVLTGDPPLRWQRRLYERMVAGPDVDSIDIPTGLGKTRVIAIWLVARAAGADVPRRLVYVVDRRAVVDQATEEAERLRRNLTPGMATRLGIEGKKLAISTLRGGFADNRAWLTDPSAPAIVVGTVDMVGSRLLFSGYGVSRSMRPNHAGLLGADALVLVDEAHLSPAFVHLVRAAGDPTAAGIAQGPSAVRVLPLSATGRARGDVFALDEEDRQETLVARRLDARKALTVEDAGKPDARQIAGRALALADGASQPPRILIYLQSRDLAQKVHQELARQLKGGEAGQPLLLVGARRGLEREQAARQLHEAGFIAGARPEAPAFLVATAAGEVGIDLDADHMLCDLVPWERMVQRLGRVNRRGDGQAEVAVLDFGEHGFGLGGDKPRELARRAAARAILGELLQVGEDKVQAGPGAITALRAREGMEARIADASTPPPLHPALTRPLVDAWAMTGLVRHEGRPQVAPWLRGWVEDRPQTRVVWRRHLPVRRGMVPVAAEVGEFFAAAPTHRSEQLETETDRVHDWLTGARNSLALAAAEMLARRVEADGAADPPGEGEVAVLVLDPALGLRAPDAYLTFRELGTMAGKSLPRESARRRDAVVRNMAGGFLVIDARLGGLSEGLLDGGAREMPVTADAAWAEEDDAAVLAAGPTISALWAHRRLRGFRASGDGPEEPVIRWQVRARSANTTPNTPPGWRVTASFDRAMDPVSGEVTERLDVLSWRGNAGTEDSRSITRREVTLADHSDHVEHAARAIAQRLGLSEDETRTLRLAARLHDTGKAAAVWQQAMAPLRAAEGEPLAKAPGGNGRLLQGYRHEFGSLLAAGDDPEVAALDEATRDLVLHLIAAHHGHARPVLRPDGCAAGPPTKLAAQAGEVAQRFARLSRRLGPWRLAWWEALLRAADRQASAAEEDADG